MASEEDAKAGKASRRKVKKMCSTLYIKKPKYDDVLMRYYYDVHDGMTDDHYTFHDPKLLNGEQIMERVMGIRKDNDLPSRESVHAAHQSRFGTVGVQ